MYTREQTGDTTMYAGQEALVEELKRRAELHAKKSNQVLAAEAKINTS